MRVHLRGQAVEGSRVKCGVACGNVLFEMKHGDHTVPSAHWSEHCAQRAKGSAAVSSTSNLEDVVATALAESDELELDSLFGYDGREESGDEFFEHGKDAGAHVGNELVVIIAGDVVASESRSLVMRACAIRVGVGKPLEGCGKKDLVCSVGQSVTFSNGIEATSLSMRADGKVLDRVLGVVA